MKKRAIGIDLGGTTLSVGLVTSDGTVEKIRKQSLIHKDVSSIVNFITTEVQVLLAETSSDLEGVGIGVPGIVNSEQGIVFQSPHFPTWRDIPIKRLLSEKIQCPITLDNDANMFALGEQRFGAGRACRNFIMLTLGSGIGCGLVLEGKLFRGDRGFAGEVGHMVIEPDGPPCHCGSRGCWELYAASHAFRHLSGEKNLTPENMALLAEKGDKVALKLWEEFGRYLGMGIHSLINVLGVTRIIIAGGILGGWDYFFDAAKKEMVSRAYAENAKQLVLQKSELGNNGGVIGAASSVLITRLLA